MPRLPLPSSSSEHHHFAITLLGLVGHGAGVGEEEDLDGQGEAKVQSDDDDEQNLARLAVGCAENGVEVAQQEGDADAEADGDEDPVEYVDGRRGGDGDGDPDEVGVAVEGPALEEVGRLGAEVAQGEEEADWDEEGVAVDEASSACGGKGKVSRRFYDLGGKEKQHTAQQLKVVGKRRVTRLGQVLADGTAKEEDEDDGGSDPKGPVQVGVALEDVEKVGARVQRGPAALQDGRRVDVKVLGVKGDCPEEALRAGAGRRRRRHRRREARRAGPLASRARGLVEVGVVELEVLLEVGVAEVALEKDGEVSNLVAWLLRREGEGRTSSSTSTTAS